MIRVNKISPFGNPIHLGLFLVSLSSLLILKITNKNDCIRLFIYRSKQEDIDINLSELNSGLNKGNYKQVTCNSFASIFVRVSFN